MKEDEEIRELEEGESEEEPEEPEKLRIITSSDISGIKKKKSAPKMITTKDLQGHIYHRNQEEPARAITPEDVRDNE